jgi:hypothetical protein
LGCNFEAVVKSITTSDTIEGTCENAVFDTFGKVFHGFSCITKGTVNAEWSAQSPRACRAEEISKSTGFNSVPVIDALSNSAGLVGEAVPVAALFDEIHLKN